MILLRTLLLTASLAAFFPSAAHAQAVHWRFEASPADTPALSAQGEAPRPVTLPAPQGAGRNFPSRLSSPVAPNQRALAFNGRGHLEADRVPELPLDGTFSIEALGNRAATLAESAYLVSHWDNTTRDARSWGLATAGSRPPPGLKPGELFLVLSPDGRQTVILGSGLILETDQDYYIAATLRFDRDQGQVRFEICNLSAAGSLQTTLRPHSIASLHASPAPLRLGAYDGPRGRWPGLLDEIRLTPGPLRDADRLIAGLPAEPPVELAAIIDPDQLATLETNPWPVLGTVRPRHAREISGSSWSVGGETIDRDFTLYKNWREHLGPLGAKHLRLQAGWARTERVKGVYDWAWLDEPVHDAVAQGVAPWINVSYGNPAYEGGGGAGLHAAAPSTPEARAAWDRWLAAMVTRYRDTVTTWEIWNEPHGSVSIEDYTDLYLRSAQIIRRIQPEARLIAFGLAGIQIPYVESFLAELSRRKLLHLVDEISYHAYVYVPEQHYGQVGALRRLIARHDPRIIVRQGENGAPSRRGGFGALTARDWTESTQAKWNLRRMLGDHGRDIPNSLFSIVDMHYPKRINNKGLLQSTKPDQTVERPKLAYHAAQNVYSIFDDTIATVAPFPRRSDHPEPDRLQVFGYRHLPSGRTLATLWLGHREVVDANALTPIRLTLENASFRDPVWVDLRTGAVHAVPAAFWSASGSSVTFTGLPIYDSPVVLADRADIPLTTR